MVFCYVDRNMKRPFSAGSRLLQHFDTEHYRAPYQTVGFTNTTALHQLCSETKHAGLLTVMGALSQFS